MNVSLLGGRCGEFYWLNNQIAMMEKYKGYCKTILPGIVIPAGDDDSLRKRKIFALRINGNILI